MTDNEQILTYGPGFPGGNDFTRLGDCHCELYDHFKGGSSVPRMCNI